MVSGQDIYILVEKNRGEIGKQENPTSLKLEKLSIEHGNGPKNNFPANHIYIKQLEEEKIRVNQRETNGQGNC